MVESIVAGVADQTDEQRIAIGSLVGSAHEVQLNLTTTELEADISTDDVGVILRRSIRHIIAEGGDARTENFPTENTSLESVAAAQIETETIQIVGTESGEVLLASEEDVVHVIFAVSTQG